MPADLTELEWKFLFRFRLCQIENKVIEARMAKTALTEMIAMWRWFNSGSEIKKVGVVYGHLIQSIAQKS